MNWNKIAVFDFETDSPDPNVCQPVQLACVIIDPRNLRVIEGSEFVSDMRPIDINQPDYYTKYKDTIEWHSKNYGCTPEEIFAKWKDAPLQKSVWNDFCDYLLKYHKQTDKKSLFSAPLPAGANILRFDLTIVQRLCTLYGQVSSRGESNIFFNRDLIDTQTLAFYWFENMNEPKSYSADSLKDFFGMSKANSHDALGDCKFCAELICKFMRLNRRFAPSVHFKGSCSK